MNTLQPLRPPDAGDGYRPCPGMAAEDFARAFLLKHPITLRRFCEKERVTPEELCSLFEDVLVDWELAEETHSGYSDAARHMINHIRKKIYANRNRTAPKGSAPGSGGGEDERMAAIAQAILRQSAGHDDPR